HTILDRAAGGEHQHRRLDVVGAQLAADLQPIHAGQHEVEHDQIIGVAGRQVVAGDAIVGYVHGVPLLAEHTTQDVRQALFVFHHQDVHSVAPSSGRIPV